ncbi:Anaphase-promoting complex subunit 11 [Liparis tanakae]|uniref:Anaphase-promoting complex subunit 11 n=2 Tax=Liparidae TaxID=183715 RepID=A0A4Z2FGG3_9TELE|nr:Anaphase-promoting complex subunit 11 [Liparis tanakae]
MSSRDILILSDIVEAARGAGAEDKELSLTASRQQLARSALLRRSMKVKIRQWNGVASWLWVANDENCGICRMHFNGCCPDCKVPGDDCPLVWGQCSHCFHMHCILKWLNSQQVQQQCPMCRQEWKFKE